MPAIVKNNMVFVTRKYDKALIPNSDLLGRNNRAMTARIIVMIAIKPEIEYIAFIYTSR
jgi:hypothetical protein